MKNRKIIDGIALAIGIAMFFCGARLSLHQHDLKNQTTGEFVTYVALLMGGFLIALIAAYELGRPSRK